ncbi:MAG: class I SAM-dependent methyltransferase [Planctomycetes bacterium]|nr:class I SAM-dependent methyltransferase [Planctomycetota bacterium]
MGTGVIDDSLVTLSELYDYNHWVFSTFRRHVEGRVLEVGAGTGNITRFLSMIATEVVALEPVPGFRSEADKCLGHMRHVSSRSGYLHEMAVPAEPGAMFDTVVSCNVLEHIEDDVAALRQMRGQLRPGGKVITFVPAGPVAFGQLDRELGHFRRYTRASLRKAYEAAGLEWVEGRYSNLVGLAGWWFNSVVLRRKHVPVRQAVSFNKLVPLLSAFERMLPMPMGQSVVGVARRPIKE